MSTQRGIDRRTADELLAGTGTGPLAGVLRAAAAPGHPEDLAGEEAAVAAFRDAALDAVPARPSVLRSVLAKVLTVKALVVVAVAGSTGVVLAASGGAIPLPWTDPAPPPPSASSTAVTPSAAPGGTGEPAAPGHDKPGAPRPDPSLAGLCQAYASGGKDGKALDNPAFGALVAAAGGPERVPAYCDAMRTAASSSAAPSTSPTEGRPPADETNPSKPSKPAKSSKHATPPTPTKTTNSPKPARTTHVATPPAGPGKPGSARTPVSPPVGAATAVPPSGAEPPSQGG